MKHFIGTRFNLKTSSWKTNKNGNKVLTDEWLNQRFEIFELYCLRSLKNQDTTDFSWCLFFDVSTPEYYKEKISKLTVEYNHFHILYIEGMNALVPSFRKFILSNISLNDEYVVTSRLDNDDFLASNYVSTIKNMAKPIDNLVIDLKRGYQLVTDIENFELRDYYHNYNQFISVVENVNSMNTIFSKEHYHWSELPNVVKFDKQPLWIEVSHKENYVNNRQAKLKLAYSIDEKRFDLPIKLNFLYYQIINHNLKLSIKKIRIRKNEFIYKTSRLPFRIKRYSKKKIKYYGLEYGFLNNNSKWPYVSKRLKQKFLKEVNLLSSEETINIIQNTIKNKKSGAYLRFGDGDVLLMMGENDSLHKANISLSKEMKEAFMINGDFIHKSLPIKSNLFGFEKNMKNGIHLSRDIDALKYLSVTYKYYNLSQIFSTVALHHLSTNNKEYCIQFLRFLKSHNPIFVGNHDTNKKLVNKLFGNIHIKTPSNNSYNEIDRIEKELTNILDLENEFKVVVVSMGCPGRILQKRIINKGYNVYLFDFGSLLDAFNKKQTRAWVRLTGGVDNYLELLNEI